MGAPSRLAQELAAKLVQRIPLPPKPPREYIPGDVLRLKRVRQATPPWADRKAIAAIYAKARAMSRRSRTGIQYQVDHVVPIAGRYVSGLHVEYNLRIITKQKNTRKGRAYRP